MKTIPRGYSTSFEVNVTETMTVDFEQSDPDMGRLHRVYATYWMAKHMELVSRLIILPFLEEHEEGIGFEVAVKHIASALPGMRVTLRAEHLRSERNRIYSRCEAHNELGDKIGEGSTTQVVLPRERLNASFAKLKQRWEAHHGP